MGFLKDLAMLLSGVGEALVEEKKRVEEKQASEDTEMEAKGYVKEYYSNGSIWVKKGSHPISTPKLLDKNGREIRPFTSNDFNNNRPKC